MAYAMVAELFSKWGGQKCASKKLENFVIWIDNCDITSTEIWRH